MPNDVHIDPQTRIKPEPFAGCFFNSDKYTDVWMGVRWGGNYALVSLQRGIFLTAPTKTREEAFGPAGSDAFEQITNTITIVPEL